MQCLLFNKGVSGHFHQISFFKFRKNICLLRYKIGPSWGWLPGTAGAPTLEEDGWMFGPAVSFGRSHLPLALNAAQWPPRSLWATVVKSACSNGANELILTVATAK